MFDLIIHQFIPNYKNVEDAKVRERYGVLCSILSIICNIMLVIFKLTFGTLVHSIAIIADGYNNLSDVGSNLATLFGFKLANKHPDADHPYGHGRYEYLAGLFISLLILVVGVLSLKESVLKVITPEKVTFSIPALIALFVSIGVKFWMSYFNNKAGDLVNSTSLKAAGQDSLNDVMTTSSTVIALVACLFTTLPVDGIIGSLVSVLVIKSGIEIAKTTIDPLLGQKPDKELIEDIEEFILGYDAVIGIHDLMLHDYGPGRRYLTIHCEVCSDRDVMELHDQMDVIERDMLEKYNILTTIHMDPIDLNDPFTNQIREDVDKIVESINPDYTIHDLRVVRGTTHTNIIFDVLMPSGDDSDTHEIRERIVDNVKALNKTYYCVIQFDHSFV